MDDHASQPPHPTRGTIDSRDHFIEGLYRILESPPEGEVDKTKEMFLALSQLVEWAKTFSGQLESFTASLSSSGSRQEEAWKQLYVKLKEFVFSLKDVSCLHFFFFAIHVTH